MAALPASVQMARVTEADHQRARTRYEEGWQQIAVASTRSSKRHQEEARRRLDSRDADSEASTNPPAAS